ncbi:MAG: hypothetical protein M1832_002427 [Thelocarpon impressellum]|nr:MAG: hypothetical protein M1832_002427 [Thelocarpon impressellum]
MARRKSSTLHYQTFSVGPPKSRGRTPTSSPTLGNDGNGNRTPQDQDSHQNGGPGGSPLPTRQLIILAIIALAEQTAFNSISPYLPEMASTFPEVDASRVGLYVGIIASSFALAQFATNFYWGWLSDRIGRKPVILIGTALTAACFVAFGFCRNMWQAVLVQVMMGLVNGNQGVVATCLGEITDRSNQSKAFLYLPVVYGLGAITGPAVGGLLVSRETPPKEYPYLAPNLLSAGVLLVDLVLAMIFLEESLEEAKELPPLGKRVESIFAWLWQFTSSSRPSYLRLNRAGHRQRGDDGEAPEDGQIEVGADDDVDADTASQVSMPTLIPQHVDELKSSHVLHRDTILLLATYLIFQLSNVSYNSLYPIFASSPPPTGRGLSPEEIGLSLSFAGAVTIVITLTLTVFGQLRDQLSKRKTYRVSLAGLALAFMLMPWVGYKEGPGPTGSGSGKVWLWIELGAALLIKSISTVGGLTSALLLITNSAPNHNVLGRLNGLAQTLSAAGRAAGPFLSGGLFSLSTQVEPKGEALAWGVFGGVALVGCCMSFGIRSGSLEGGTWDAEEEDAEANEAGDPESHASGSAAVNDDQDESGDEIHDLRRGETQALLSQRKK